MNDPSDSVHLEVLVEGSDVALDVVSAAVEDHDVLLDQATIVVADPHRSYTDFVQEGVTVRVAMGWTSQNAVLFEGQVARVRGHADRDGRRYVTLVALDPGEVMHREPKFRHHTGTVSAIVRTVAEEHGLTAERIVVDPDPEFPDDAPLRQTDQTDWDFLLDLAQRYEARAFVEYNDGGPRFYFVAAGTLLQAEPVGALRYGASGGTLLRFDYRRAAERASARVRATVTDPATGEAESTSPLTPVPPAVPVLPDAAHVAALGSADSTAAARYSAVAELLATSTGNPAEHRPVRVAAGLPSDPGRIERAALYPDDPTALGWVGRARALGSVLLRAKSRVTLEGVGAWADGEWYIARARHVFRDRRYHTELTVTR